MLAKMWKTRQAHKLLMGVEIDNVLSGNNLAGHIRHFSTHVTTQ